eukprot:scaffold76926_cov40-Prasinocladus_malaysianus.AAC.1
MKELAARPQATCPAITSRSVSTNEPKPLNIILPRHLSPRSRTSVRNSKTHTVNTLDRCNESKQLTQSMCTAYTLDLFLNIRQNWGNQNIDMEIYTCESKLVDQKRRQS